MYVCEEGWKPVGVKQTGKDGKGRYNIFVTSGLMREGAVHMCVILKITTNATYRSWFFQTWISMRARKSLAIFALRL